MMPHPSRRRFAEMHASVQSVIQSEIKDEHQPAGAGIVAAALLVVADEIGCVAVEMRAVGYALRHLAKNFDREIER